MNDSADIKLAAERLNQALQSLERSLDPMVEDLGRYKKIATESEGFATDRSRLAQELDDAKAREETLKSRQVDFKALADETTTELDRAISKVREVLERGA